MFMFLSSILFTMQYYLDASLTLINYFKELIFSGLTYFTTSAKYLTPCVSEQSTM